MNAKTDHKIGTTRSQVLSALLLALSVLPWGAGPATPIGIKLTEGNGKAVAF